MSFVNLYKPPVPAQETPSESQLYGPDPFDVNFAFPLHLESLESERVCLTPFIPRVHGQAFWEGVEATKQDLWRFFPISVPADLPEFLAYIEKYYRSNPEFILFAVIDKTRRDERRPELDRGSVAGVIGLIRASPVHLYAEIGYVLVLPAFQRTHVATNAVGILLKYCLQLPSASPPGLGLRQAQYGLNPENQASLRLAQRLGFKHEGVLRWTWVMPESRALEGKAPREGDPHAPRGSMDSMYVAVCWDDWKDGGRERAQAAIDR